MNEKRFTDPNSPEYREALDLITRGGGGINAVATRVARALALARETPRPVIPLHLLHVARLQPQTPRRNSP